MSRSERYIPPTEEELQRWQREKEDAERFESLREELLRKALKKVKKADLVEMTLRAAKHNKETEWLLEKKFGLEKPVDLIVHDIGVAIDRATKVNERELNYNFSFDWDAYDAVRHGLSELIRKDAIAEAKRLALDLMRKGSYQIECSDEGLMQDQIEACLRVVIEAVKESPDTREWAQEMIRADCVGFVCERELAALAEFRTGSK